MISSSGSRLPGPENVPVFTACILRPKIGDFSRLRVPVGNMYDWKPGTSVKYLYELTDLRRLRPFRIQEVIPHGRAWAEFTR